MFLTFLKKIPINGQQVGTGKIRSLWGCGLLYEQLSASGPDYGHENFRSICPALVLFYGLGPGFPGYRIHQLFSVPVPPHQAGLHQSGIEPVGAEFPGAPGAGEKTPFVFGPLRLNQECAFEIKFGEDHGTPPGLTILALSTPLPSDNS